MENSVDQSDPVLKADMLKKASLIDVYAVLWEIFMAGKAFLSLCLVTATNVCVLN